MKKWLAIIIFGFCQFAFSQTEKDSIITVSVTDKETQAKLNPKPEFPGGLSAFYTYITNNFRITDGEKGALIIKFTVNTDGSLSDIMILRSIGRNSSKEIMRVLKKCPKWRSGQLDGKAVKVEYSLPINIAN